jgi:hypothetical protein
MSQDRDWWWTLCEHANEPLGSIEGNFFTSWVSISFSRKILLME